MAYELSEIGNLIVVISGALGSLLLIVFKSRCRNILWGCIKRDVINDDEENPLQRTEENASGAT